jgi:hypothetical protein
MPNTVQEFLATAAEKTVADLEAALLRLPEDKRNVSPMGDARTPADLVAEVAILNGTTAELLKNRHFPENYDFAAFGQDKKDLAQDWDQMKSLLYANTARVAEAIRAVPDEDLGIEVAMPWGPMTLRQIAAYPFWNMSYHEGQINYVASMYGCLD